MSPEISVIIPVYNAVRFLELVLAGFCRQSFREFEVFIADDGSGPEMRAFVNNFSRQSLFPVRYVWHPDEGFRRSAILNLAVRESSARYLIFADGDCIPHRHFVRAHFDYRAARTVLCGRRAHLSPSMSESLTPEDILAGKPESWHARIRETLSGKSNHWDEGFLLGNPILHRWANRKAPTLLGSNFSLERSLLEEINGFNEDFVGYGGEDTELEIRLRRAGARFQWVRHRAVQYHLFHTVRPASPANITVLEQTQNVHTATCHNGLRKGVQT